MFYATQPPPVGGPPLETLRRVFGYHSFRPQQEEIIGHIVAGGDAFVLMPTGGGKSLCYQLPALLRPGVGIVVSPLISLMKDQVDALVANGVRAAFYNSSLAPQQARSVLARLHGGELDLLYVAPERLMTPDFLRRLAGDGQVAAVPVALFAIDEAHCVSQWGHDFRPEYIDLGRLRGLFPGVPILACTATADPETRVDVKLRLGLREAPLYVAGFDRPNIRYTVRDKIHPREQLLAFVALHAGESGIVYCLSRKRTEEVTAQLQAAGVRAAAYHAGLPAEERRRVQEGFQHDEVHVVVATVAFGMGIDKPDVRYVVHHDLPKTLESYYQETGRCGRDGLPAEALLLFGLADVAVARGLIEHGGNSERVRIDAHKLNAMVGFAEAQTCRRRVLLGYFGERLESDCGNCDVCLEPPERYDATQHAQMALSCVYRVGQRFGAAHVADVLRGAETERIFSLGHDQLSTYGIGAELSRDAWLGLIRQLVHLGYLRQDMARYSVLTLTPAAVELLRGDQQLVLAKPRVRPLAERRKRAPRSRSAVPGERAPESPLTDAEAALYEHLRELRRRLADEAHVPAYVVFSDATLREMASKGPQTDAELLAVNGVGAAKLARYGARFLAVLHADEQPAGP
jgi:ATP-dependent DNA helicase RecQ